MDVPLAEQIRPQNLAQFVGQRHLLDDGKPLHAILQQKQPCSLLFWGPPGVGKTTLARLLAAVFDVEFVALSAIFSGVRELRQVFDQAAQLRASTSTSTLLFIDEIHRFNKSQQDAFLPVIEDGTILLVGATTENPSFSLNNALLSRLLLFVLEPLARPDLLCLVERVAKALNYTETYSDEVLDLLTEYAQGDGRRLINALDVIHAIARSEHKPIDDDLVRQSLSNALPLGDNKGDHFYDQISALHKTVRGSNPDAALYWLTRLLQSGVDPNYLSRRLIRIAWEDIGLADPRAAAIAVDAAQTYERLGSPEGELALANAVVYLAVAPKSNAMYQAFKSCNQFVAKHQSLPVPLKLRNASTGMMAQLGYGQHYQYAHDAPQAYVAGENYFPEGLATPPSWYQPTERGLEIKIKEKLQRLTELDAKARRSTPKT